MGLLRIRKKGKGAGGFLRPTYPGLDAGPCTPSSGSLGRTCFDGVDRSRGLLLDCVLLLEVADLFRLLIFLTLSSQNEFHQLITAIHAVGCCRLRVILN